LVAAGAIWVVLGTLSAGFWATALAGCGWLGLPVTSGKARRKPTFWGSAQFHTGTGQVHGPRSNPAPALTIVRGLLIGTFRAVLLVILLRQNPATGMRRRTSTHRSVKFWLSPRNMLSAARFHRCLSACRPTEFNRSRHVLRPRSPIVEIRPLGRATGRGRFAVFLAHDPSTQFETLFRFPLLDFSDRHQLNSSIQKGRLTNAECIRAGFAGRLKTLTLDLLELSGEAPLGSKTAQSRRAHIGHRGRRRRQTTGESTFTSGGKAYFSDVAGRAVRLSPNAGHWSIGRPLPENGRRWDGSEALGGERNSTSSGEPHTASFRFSPYH